MKKHRLLAAIVAGGCALLASTQSYANSIMVSYQNQTANGGNTDYNYKASLTEAGQVGVTNQLVAGDFFVLSDFGNVVGASGPAGFTVSYEFQSVIPIGDTAVPLLPGTVPFDDPSIVNVRFTYTGGTQVGPQDLGAFFVTAAGSVGSQVTTQEFYAGRDTAVVTGTGAGTFKEENTTTTTVAADTGNQTVITPLPATAWGGMALFALVAGKRRRKI